MSERFNDIVERFKRLIYWSRQVSDQADAKVRQVNKLIRQLGEAGWVSHLAILGPIIHQWSYEPRPGGSDSGQLVQAALLVPDGIGVVIWDTEQYADLRNVAEGLEAEAKVQFVPFAACEPAVKGLLFVAIEPLLERLNEKLTRL